MKRLYIRHAYEIYTRLKQVLIDLDLKNKDYLWLISDIEAYPRKKEYEELLENNSYLLLTTKELIDMLEADDFQWVWAVFSAIPSCFQKEDILKFDLPYVENFEKGKYNPHIGEPKLQHPYAEFELYAVDSSYMFMISDNEELISKFKKSYPKYIEE
jgi:hypothetical protein